MLDTRHLSLENIIDTREYFTEANIGKLFGESWINELNIPLIERKIIMPMEKKVFKSMLIISAFFIVSCTSMPSEFELADIRKEQSGKTEVKLYEKLNFKDHYKQWKKILEKDEVYAQSQKGIRFVYALNYYYQTVADEKYSARYS